MTDCSATPGGTREYVSDAKNRYLSELEATGKVSADPAQILEDCGYSNRDFNPRLIAEQLAPERIKLLKAGADPTAAELALWRAAAINETFPEQAAPDEILSGAFELYRVKHRHREMYLYRMPGSWGRFGKAQGPFRTLCELDAHLIEHLQAAAVPLARFLVLRGIGRRPASPATSDSHVP